MLRESPDVHLVDDGPGGRAAERLVAFPIVVRRIGHHTSHGRRRVVARKLRIVAGIARRNCNTAAFSGTGNTLKADHPIVRRMILDSLRYWVGEMHVDGFRFDLASILARDSSGQVLSNPPVLWDIESDPALAGTKFIAEAWDAAGLYQVDSFVGDSWKEWNGRFRDDVRAFLGDQ